MRITADTNFFVSATQWDNSIAHKILVKLIEANAEIFTTKDILNEFSEVLQRDFEYNEEETNEIIEKVMSFVTLVEAKEKLNVVKDDPDDNKVLEYAIASKSEYILAYDKHLLNLRAFRGIKIIKPDEIIYDGIFDS